MASRKNPSIDQDTTPEPESSDALPLLDGRVPEPVKAQRRTQEDRSRDAKERLLAATISVLRRKGYNGLTTKEVAKTAGLSNGALMHHYANKAELVIAATAAVYDECIIRGQRLARTPQAVKKPIESFISDQLSVYFDWPFHTALEVIVVSRTDPELMARIYPVMDHYRKTTNALWLEVFKKAGHSPQQARTILNLSLNMVRGMAVNRMWAKDETYYDDCLKDWIKIVNEKFPVGKPSRQAGKLPGP
ncbi:MAG TPA: TetR/AcrR family transcriptional regulator [Eoetvoesiella sp.]|uniref:TetR/AcrR family transcriptional regulator n=1 Tax=Eoetvoesiella sp. TaxID=1966355 RepID=UPI002B98B1FE|nr:TetR/AcrR family transcriptional regulator [Eoetvoesiella sp.]HWK60425.1 TetR/AcrR family transcriptional regulator [Eoetvoesiella sp.]